jgi:hypothetical protein
MANSNIKCRFINRIGCEYYDEMKLCPDNCVGFYLKDEYIKSEIPVSIENEEIVENDINSDSDSDSEEPIKRKYIKRSN